MRIVIHDAIPKTNPSYYLVEVSTNHVTLFLFRWLLGSWLAPNLPDIQVIHVYLAVPSGR